MLADTQYRFFKDFFFLVGRHSFLSHTHFVLSAFFAAHVSAGFPLFRMFWCKAFSAFAIIISSGVQIKRIQCSARSGIWCCVSFCSTCPNDLLKLNLKLCPFVSSVVWYACACACVCARERSECCNTH